MGKGSELDFMHNALIRGFFKPIAGMAYIFQREKFAKQNKQQNQSGERKQSEKNNFDFLAEGRSIVRTDFPRTRRARRR